MARSPQQLLTELTRSRKEQADRLERDIDTALDREYRGGPFVYQTQEILHETVVRELRIRYFAWLVDHRSYAHDDCREKMPGVNTALTFTPMPGAE